MQTGQIMAAPPPLGDGLIGAGRAGHVPGQAVPQVLVADERADGFGDHPPGIREMTQHRVLVGQVRPGRLGVVAA